MDYKKLREIEQEFIKSNGYMRTKEFANKGFAYYYLAELKEDGLIDEVKRGLYRWADMDFAGKFQYIDVSKIVPDSVFCTYSALRLLGLSTFIPNYYDIAIDRAKGYIPSLPNYPSITVKTFSGIYFTLGIISMKIDTQEIRLYDMEKTLCDHIRLRLDIHNLKEAFSDYLNHKDMDLEKLSRYGKLMRIEKRLTNYLEVLV